MAKRFSENDLRFLRDNFEKMDVQLLAEHLGARLEEIEAKIEKMGLKPAESASAKTLSSFKEMYRHSEAARKEYEKGFALLQKKKYEDAERHFRTLLADFADERELVDRARVYLAVCERRHKTSRPTSGDPEEEAYYAALFEKNRENFEGAIDHLKKSSSRKNGDGRAAFLLACCYARLGDAERALDALVRAIAEDEGNRLLARRDPDLESVRSLPRFDQIAAASA